MHKPTQQRQSVDRSYGGGEGGKNSLPEYLRSHMDKAQIEQITRIANDMTPITIEGIPIAHLHCALNCMLKTLAGSEPATPQFTVVDTAQAIFVELLEDLLPGVNEGYQVLYEYYQYLLYGEGLE